MCKQTMRPHVCIRVRRVINPPLVADGYEYDEWHARATGFSRYEWSRQRSGEWAGTRWCPWSWWTFTDIVDTFWRRGFPQCRCADPHYGHLCSAHSTCWSATDNVCVSRATAVAHFVQVLLKMYEPALSMGASLTSRDDGKWRRRQYRAL